MSSEKRDREVRYYQDRIRQLQIENRQMKGALSYRPLSRDPVTDTIVDLGVRNQRLEREAQKYQQGIKNDLTSFIRNSNVMDECMFKRKYISSLNYPPSLSRFRLRR